jgi:predicted DNA-binding transcriptional regulator AlpA
MEIGTSAPLLTTRQAAEYLNYEIRTLEAWRFRGGGPRFVRVSPKSVRYRKADLEVWIEERVRTSTSQQS